MTDHIDKVNHLPQQGLIYDLYRLIDNMPAAPNSVRLSDARRHDRRRDHVYQIPELKIQYVRDSSCSTREKTIKGPKDAADFSRTVINNNFQEVLIVLVLDINNRLIGHSEISVGTVDRTLARTPDVLRPVINTPGAMAFMLVHNHPSGNVEPSSMDLATHKKIFKAAEDMEIPLLDALIITNNSDKFYSAKSSYDI